MGDAIGIAHRGSWFIVGGICRSDRRVALFVHGCFWHGHDCPRGARVPQANRPYCTAKIGRNMARDTATLAALRRLGWKPVVIWECETRDPKVLSRLIVRRVGKPARA